LVAGREWGDSVLPNFRGKDGFWRAYPALRDAGINFYSIASPQTFHSASVQVLGFYRRRLALYRRTQLIKDLRS